MNWRTSSILFLSACLVTWALPDLGEARGGGRGGGGGGGFSRGGGGGGISRGGGGNFGSVRNSAGPATRNVSRPATGSTYRSSQGTYQGAASSQLPADRANRMSQGGLSTEQRQQVQDRAAAMTPEQRQQMHERAANLTPEQRQQVQDRAATMTPEQRQQVQDRAANLTPEQKQKVQDRVANLTPEQKDQLRQKFENSGVRPGQLPADIRDENREDWQNWADHNREDWQDWYDDRYDDYWDDHWHSSWWYGYPVSTVSYSFYIDDTPPCQKTVVINQATGTTTYYYCNSMWYQPAYAGGEVKYIVTSPPAGGEMTSLSNPYELTVGGQLYFVSNHVFYQKITRDGQTLYVTVDAPPGALVSTIPEYAVEIVHQGQTYYRFDRIFYQQEGNYFVVVANPGV